MFLSRLSQPKIEDGQHSWDRKYNIFWSTRSTSFCFILPVVIIDFYTICSFNEGDHNVALVFIIFGVTLFNNFNIIYSAYNNYMNAL